MKIEVTSFEIEAILTDVINLYLIPRFDSHDMNATGEWKENIQARTNQIWGRQYTEQLVYGRKDGKMPPIEPLKRWAMAKFGLDEQQAEGAAWGIAKNIAKYGTTHYRSGGTDLLEVLESAEVLDYINKRVGEILLQKTQELFLKEINIRFKR